MAVIATVITGIAAVILRTDGPTTARAQDSRSLRGLNTWLGQDVSGVAPSGFDIPGDTTGCTGSSPGTSLVHLSWSETTSSTTNYVANYRLVDQGAGDFRVERHTCSGLDTGPYGNVTVQRLTSALATSPTPTVNAVMDGGDVIGVEMTVYTLEGEAIKVDGGTRNPSATLAPTTTTSITSTTTTTTTLPPGSCALVGSPGITATANPVANNGNGVKQLSTDVTISITVTGTCGPLTLEYDRDDGAGLQSEAFGGTFPNYSLVLEKSNSRKWNDGPSNHALEVYDDTTLLNTVAYNLEVT
jgi:hypothetical protein